MEPLIRAGADVNARDGADSTALHYAGRNGLLKAAELLLAAGAEVNARDCSGWTPLQRAAIKGHTEVATLLVSHGAKINSADNSGMTPLHEAARREFAIVRLLIEHGADMNARTNQGDTPLDLVQLSSIKPLLLAHGAVNGKQVKGDTVLTDVTPLTLKVEIPGGGLSTLIPRNTPIPTRKSFVFSTSYDMQTTIEVHVLQGESQEPSKNRMLCKFVIERLNPLPRGETRVDVLFDIDADGILHVSAKDTASGKEQKIEIKTSSSLRFVNVKNKMLSNGIFLTRMERTPPNNDPAIMARLFKDWK